MQNCLNKLYKKATTTKIKMKKVNFLLLRIKQGWGNVSPE
jgi:hypothetical protein